MASGGAVRVEGLAEFQRGLKRLAPETAKEFRSALLDVGQDIVHEAQSNVPVKSGTALNSIKAGSNAQTVYVQGGKTSVPYYPWLDFGGVLRPTGGRRGTQVRDFRKKGRYLYPAIDKYQKKITAAAVAAFDKSKSKVF